MPKKTKKNAKNISHAKIEKGPHGKVHLQWQFAEFEQFDRGILWYLVMGGIALALLIYAIWTMNFLFAIIILLASFIIYLHHRQEAEMLDFKITEDGLEIGKDFHRYKDLKKFWIIYDPPKVKNLYFSTYRILKPDISIPLHDINPLKVRKILLNYLDEDLDKEDEAPTDRWARWLRI